MRMEGARPGVDGLLDAPRTLRAALSEEAPGLVLRTLTLPRRGEQARRTGRLSVEAALPLSLETSSRAGAGRGASGLLLQLRMVARGIHAARATVIMREIWSFVQIAMRLRLWSTGSTI